jgi:hypothetical protein
MEHASRGKKVKHLSLLLTPFSTLKHRAGDNGRACRCKPLEACSCTFDQALVHLLTDWSWRFGHPDSAVPVPPVEGLYRNDSSADSAAAPGEEEPLNNAAAGKHHYWAKLESVL